MCRDGAAAVAVNMAAVSAPLVFARCKAADHEIITFLLNISALDQFLSRCFKVISINSSKNTTLFMQETVYFFFFRILESQSRPLCISPSVAI